MPTYYEVLNLAPTATLDEIEAALDAQYGHWQRFVKHPDPMTAKRATQALRFLKTVRENMLDPVKRAAYDASLNTQGTVGGLVDPQAKPQANVPPAPKPRVYSSVTAVDPPPDTWTCPQCQAPNVRKMRDCPRCGTRIAHKCPKCDKLIQKAARFCSHCGVNVQAEINRQRRDQLIEQLQREQRHLDFLRRRFDKAMLSPKTDEETWWGNELSATDFELGTKAIVPVSIFLVVVTLCGAIGYAIGKAVDPMGYGYGGPASGAAIGAIIGVSTVGLSIGSVAAAYVLRCVYVEPEVKTKIKTKMKQCKIKIAQLEHQIQKASFTSHS